MERTSQAARALRVIAGLQKRQGGAAHASRIAVDLPKIRVLAAAAVAVGFLVFVDQPLQAATVPEARGSQHDVQAVEVDFAVLGVEIGQHVAQANAQLLAGRGPFLPALHAELQPVASQQADQAAGKAEQGQRQRFADVAHVLSYAVGCFLIGLSASLYAGHCQRRRDLRAQIEKLEVNDLPAALEALKHAGLTPEQQAVVGRVITLNWEHGYALGR